MIAFKYFDTIIRSDKYANFIFICLTFLEAPKYIPIFNSNLVMGIFTNDIPSPSSKVWNLFHLTTALIYCYSLIYIILNKKQNLTSTWKIGASTISTLDIPFFFFIIPILMNCTTFVFVSGLKAILVNIPLALLVVINQRRFNIHYALFFASASTYISIVYLIMAIMSYNVTMIIYGFGFFVGAGMSIMM